MSAQMTFGGIDPPPLFLYFYRCVYRNSWRDGVCGCPEPSRPPPFSVKPLSAMLAEILVFSLLAGAIVVFDTYQVFSRRDSAFADSFRARVIETTFFGTVPGVVGAILSTSVITESETAYVLFIVFTSLFLLTLFLRYAPLGRKSRFLGLSGSESTSAFLVGMLVCVSAGSVPDTSPVSSCLLYISLYYFWAADLGDESMSMAMGSYAKVPTGPGPAYVNPTFSGPTGPGPVYLAQSGTGLGGSAAPAAEPTAAPAAEPAAEPASEPADPIGTSGAFTGSGIPGGGLVTSGWR